jgi:hypothetical protein
MLACQCGWLPAACGRATTQQKLARAAEPNYSLRPWPLPALASLRLGPCTAVAPSNPDAWPADWLSAAAKRGWAHRWVHRAIAPLLRWFRSFLDFTQLVFLHLWSMLFSDTSTHHRRALNLGSTRCMRTWFDVKLTPIHPIMSPLHKFQQHF